MMNGLDIYLDAVVSLAQQLEKLLKVINHSDPTADSKKKLLHAKYQQNIKRFSAIIKEQHTWKEIHDYIQRLSKQKLPLADGVKEVIIRKILNDLESEFITKHELTEFSSTERKFQRKRTKKSRNKPTPEPSVPQEPSRYTKESILELVQMTQKQVIARANLREFITKINDLNPDRFDDKIQNYIRKQKK